jgi:hypothetical protein
MYYLIPKKIRQSAYNKAVEKYNLITQITKKIKEKNITNVDEIRSWINNNSFTEDEKVELNWLTYTI